MDNSSASNEKPQANATAMSTSSLQVVSSSMDITVIDENIKNIIISSCVQLKCISIK